MNVPLLIIYINNITTSYKVFQIFGVNMLQNKQKEGVRYLYNSTFQRKKKDKDKDKKKLIKRKPVRSKELSDHWSRVVELGPAPWNLAEGRLTVHHCHSGSISQNGISRGIGQKNNDWLVICLPESLHVKSPKAIDGSIGVLTWEAKFGTQMKSLLWVCKELNVNVFKKAGYDIDMPCIGG